MAFRGGEFRYPDKCGKEVQVTYDLDTISSYGNLSWHLRTEGKSAVINPVKHIRRLRAAQAVLREMGE